MSNPRENPPKALLGRLPTIFGDGATHALAPIGQFALDQPGTGVPLQRGWGYPA
jgi:hypothetical protein